MMTDTITCRRLGPEDIDLLLNVPPGLFDDPVIPQQARSFLNDPMHEIVLAFDAGTVVGMATGTVMLHPDKAPSMFINEVGTRDSHLRRGVATMTTKMLIAVARDRGCKGIWLATEPDNAAAIGLYRALAGQQHSGVLFDWDDAI